MIRRLLISAVLVFFIISCAVSLTSKKVIKNDIEMLYGPISVSQLYFDYPQWKKNEAQYKVSPDVIKQIASVQDNFDVKIFLATWCSDSRREVPRFLKIIKEAGLMDKLSMELFAVDRKLKLESGLAETYEIKRVPTFIFFKNGNEIGRIVESPEALLLEQDINVILNGTAK